MELETDKRRFRKETYFLLTINNRVGVCVCVCACACPCFPPYLFLCLSVSHPLPPPSLHPPFLPLSLPSFLPLLPPSPLSLYLPPSLPIAHTHTTDTQKQTNARTRACARAHTHTHLKRCEDGPRRQDDRPRPLHRLPGASAGAGFEPRVGRRRRRSGRRSVESKIAGTMRIRTRLAIEHLHRWPLHRRRGKPPLVDNGGGGHRERWLGRAAAVVPWWE